MTPISYLSVYRVRKELQLMKSIQWRIKQDQYILRMTDKSGIFHLARAQDYEQKVLGYREKTQAYIELTTNPLSTTFYIVVHLLNRFRSKKHIQARQLDSMMPKRDEVTLAYLYFIPTPHKVILIFILSTLLRRNIIKTNCFIYEYTNNSYFKVFRSITSSTI